jgi:hypothetical protein
MSQLFSGVSTEIWNLSSCLLWFESEMFPKGSCVGGLLPNDGLLEVIGSWGLWPNQQINSLMDSNYCSIIGRWSLVGGSGGWRITLWKISANLHSHDAISTSKQTHVEIRRHCAHGDRLIHVFCLQSVNSSVLFYTILMFSTANMAISALWK